MNFKLYKDNIDLLILFVFLPLVTTINKKKVNRRVQTFFADLLEPFKQESQNTEEG